MIKDDKELQFFALSFAERLPIKNRKNNLYIKKKTTIPSMHYRHIPLLSEFFKKDVFIEYSFQSKP